MDEQDTLNLAKAYQGLPEAELIDMLSASQDQYEPQVYELLVDEMKRRGIEGKVEKQKKEALDKKQKSRDKMSFGWGNLWIFVGFTAGGLLVLLMLFQAMSDPGASKLVVLAIIAMDLWLIGSSYGLLKRRKWGLTLALIFIIGGIIINASAILVGALSGKLSNPIFFILEKFLEIFIGYCWWRYFLNRKTEFH